MNWKGGIYKTVTTLDGEVVNEYEKEVYVMKEGADVGAIARLSGDAWHVNVVVLSGLYPHAREDIARGTVDEAKRLTEELYASLIRQQEEGAA